MRWLVAAVEAAADKVAGWTGSLQPPRGEVGLAGGSCMGEAFVK